MPINAIRRYSRSQVARNALSLYGIQAANYILPWFTFPYLTRVLGAEKFGAIAFAQAFITYFQIVTEYGFNFTATREISIHRDDPDKLSRIFTATIVAKTLLMAASFVAFAAIVFSVPQFRAEWPLYLIMFQVVLANVIFPQWLFQGIEKMESITYREVGSRLLGLAPTFLFVHSPSDYLIAAEIQAGSYLLAGVAGYIGFRRITTARLTPVSSREIFETYTQGWHVFVSTAAINLYTRSNIFILGLIAPRADVGYYSAAQRLVEAGKSLVFPITTAAFPHVSRVAHTDPAAGLAFIRRNIGRFTLPFAVISLGFLAGAPIIGPILFGRKFAPAIPLLQIMSPIPLVVAFTGIFATQYMLGMGFKKQWMALIVSAGVFNFVVLVPLLYFMRATLAIAITSVLVEVWGAVGSYLFYRGKWGRKAPA